MTENQNTEYKLILTDKFERAAVSFLNSKMGGVLYIGIDDDGKFNILAYLFADQNGTVNANGGINGSVNDTQNGTVNLLESERLVLEEIKRNPHVTMNEIVIVTDISRRTVARALKTLQEKQIICRIGADKNGNWKIINE
ncbi:MAG: winged helix-turn-helix transcriptional regulator [Hallerella porci]|uniref:winged helix-turn-helix transcriptional regulator n=1 Tax=Hallerella porci TaxID=1945871 RepID=UPI002A81CF0F|nr:winged helix-turn-helix transcriptional regulator [Hallerella porci]MDY3921133.1 winged helix-turn-helix transcriptional regulator [Hallerella porci]